MISPFAGIKNAVLESKNMKQNGWKVFSICAIALIPLIYAGLFLLAFLDPYGSLNQVPAAVVVEDTGSVVNAKSRNVGQELYDSLLENNENKKEGEASGFDWQETSRTKAVKGLKDGDYYMALIIPKDFTKNIASADSDSPQKAQLEVYFNPSTNLIASTVGNSMVTKIKAELNGKIQQEYYDNIFVQLTKASDQLLDAVDGANQLDEGLASAKDGSNTITVNLTTLSDGATSLEDGLKQLVSGTTTLKNGTQTLADGASTLQSSGTSEIASGASKLEAATASNSELASGSSTLTAGLGTMESSVSTLPQSTTQLADGFDTLVSTLSTSLGNESTQNTLIYGSNAVSQGASQLSSGLSTLSGNSSALTSGSAKISNGLTSLKDGSGTFKSTVAAAKQQAASAADVTTATADYKTALQSYTVAVATHGPTSAEAQAALATLTEKVTALGTASGNAGAVKALDSVESGYTALDSGITDLESGYNGDGTANNPGLNASLNTYTSYVDSAAESAPTLASGADQVNQGLNTMQSTLSSKTGSVAALSAGAHKLASSSSTLASAITSAKNGSAAITNGIGTLNSNIKTLSSGAATVDSNMKTVASGAATLNSGAAQLQSGANSAASGSSQISSGATQLAEGSKTLTDGLTTAKDGTSELKDGLVDGQKEMASNVKNSSSKTEMMSDPVTANGDSNQGENITTVKNYGTGFAPYFIALGMWVGCLMITFLLRSLNNRILMSKASSFAAVLSSYLPMACIALVQVLALLVLIQFGLGFNVNFVPQYYAFGLLVALAFMAIIQLLRAWFGTPGMVVIIVLLMLQLCTAAGTFPIEAEIGIFNWLNPFLPMTYVVKGFRVAMCGLDPSYMTSSVIVLACFLVGALALSTLIASRRRYATMATLYPKIKMVES